MVQRKMDGPEFSIDTLSDRDGRCLNAIPRSMIESRGGESIKGTVLDDPELVDLGRTVVEAIGHGRQRGVTHEYRGRVFESRFLPKAYLFFLVKDELAPRVVEAIADAARTGHESGDGLVWTTPVFDVTHNRTGERLEEVEVA